MYRNVFYDSTKQCVHLWTWNENGERIKLEASYEPYLFVESVYGTDATSIFNTPLKKVKFKNQFERNKFVNETPIKRLFHNLSCEQEFLLSTFKDDVNKPNTLDNPLKIFFWDIETYSPGEFPEPKLAKDPINLITIYDSLSKKYYSWGLKPYQTKRPDVVYKYCKRETELLQEVLRFWESNPPDMMVGWNSEGFDVPYLMNRINNLLGEEDASRLSPVRAIYYRENVAMNKMGKMIDRWYIRGVSNIDYMEVYKTFARGDRESYSLNYIGEYEEVGSKTDIGGINLASLSESDWNLFTEYNLQDVKLLVDLDEKLKYLKLIRALSYKGFIPFEQAMGKVSMITGAVAHQAVLQGYRIPTFKNDGIRDEYVGGYVHEPERGLCKSVVSYDANSLYPNTIITLNISPETKVGKIIEVVDKEYTIKLANDKIVTLNEEKFDRLLKKEDLSISKYNVLYTQKFRGVVPALIDRLYSERVALKKKVTELEDILSNTSNQKEQIRIENDILNYDTQQNVLKLVLNSIYGVFAQKYSPLFDIDHSASITLTGQAVAKEAPEIVLEYARGKGFSGDKKELYRYGDTDSAYFSIEPILKVLNISLLDSAKKVTPDASKIIKEIDKYLNSKIIEWASKELKSTDPRFVFKQETICDVALFDAKKRYILHIVEQEGKVPRKPFKYVGVEIARSTISKEVKVLIRRVIEYVMLAQDKKQADIIFKQAHVEFCNMPIENISIRSKISDYEKYEAKLDQHGQTGKGTTLQAKSAIHFNKLLKHFKIDHLYESIGSAMKLKYFYTSKNAFNFKSMAFMEKYPTELLEHVKPDYQTMFDKIVSPPLKRFYECIGWHLPQTGREVQTDLFDLFGI
jgi:DNA polymerase elongation subunit (family B)